MVWRMVSGCENQRLLLKLWQSKRRLRSWYQHVKVSVYVCVRCGTCDTLICLKRIKKRRLGMQPKEPYGSFIPLPYRYIMPMVISNGCQLNSKPGFFCQANPPKWWPVQIPMSTTAINPVIWKSNFLSFKIESKWHGYLGSMHEISLPGLRHRKVWNPSRLARLHPWWQLNFSTIGT